MSPQRSSIRILSILTVPTIAIILLAALVAFLLILPVDAEEGSGPERGSFPLIVGTSLNPTGTNHDVYEIDVVGNSSMSILPQFPVGGATYDAANDRVLFTSSSGGTNIDQLWQWTLDGSLNNLGTIMDATAGGAQRIDGLAISGGTLYGTYAGGTAEDGLWTINQALAATLVFPYSNSISGIDADPNTGIIYGVDDSTGSLVEIDPVGMTITPVTAYPAGQGDIDGLAVGNNGRAYLITDEPGFFYVYNLNTNAYEANLTNPWSNSDTFSGGAFIDIVVPEPGLAMTKTVGLDPNTCAPTNTVSVPAGHGGTTVGYCYTVMNTGNITLSVHDLVDSEAGVLLSGFNFDLAPGATIDTVAAGVVVSAVITQTTTNVATWTAAIDTVPVVTDTSSATVTVLPPTSVSLSGISGEVGTNFFALIALLAVLIGFGVIIYRKRLA